MADRDFARRLIEEYVPFDLPYYKDFEQSNRMHNEIINRFRLPNRSVFSEYKGEGTTCGYLCQWLLFRLGVTNQSLLNRTTFKVSVKPSDADFDDLSRMALATMFKLPQNDMYGKVIPRNKDDIHFQTYYEVGQNLKFCMSREMTKAYGADFDLESFIKKISQGDIYGDIGWIKGPDKVIFNPRMDKSGFSIFQNIDTSHVFIIKSAILNRDSITFETIDGGQNYGSYGVGGINVAHKTRTFKIKGNIIKGEAGDGRDLLGILSLDNLQFNAPKKDFSERLLYDPLLARLYYMDRDGRDINSISTPAKKYR
jgi:hypothetical protein